MVPLLKRFSSSSNFVLAYIDDSSISFIWDIYHSAFSLTDWILDVAILPSWFSSLIIVFIGSKQEGEKMLVVGFTKGRMEAQYEICAPIELLVWVKCSRDVIECAECLCSRDAVIYTYEVTVPSLSYLRITQKSTVWLKNKGVGVNCEGIVFWFIILFWMRLL